MTEQQQQQDVVVIRDEATNLKHVTEIPVTIFYYIQVFDPTKETYHYKIEAVGSGRRRLAYCAQNIQKSSLDGADLVQIQLFNNVYIPEYNAASLCFVFSTTHDGIYYCELTCSGTLRVVSHHAPHSDVAVSLPHSYKLARPPEPDGDIDTYLACSVYTSIHDYIQTRSGHFFHLGISFVPCGTLFIPLWLQSDYLELLLEKWMSNKMTLANIESLIAVRLLDGTSSVRHVIKRISEKHMFCYHQQ